MPAAMALWKMQRWLKSAAKTMKQRIKNGPAEGRAAGSVT
jgi:hypothetical protein